jgi:rSAM/selenodomain-associated transferase 2
MVSVVIPAYNEEVALPLTLMCVFEQEGDYEVIVAEGGSTDRTPAIVDDDRRIRAVTGAKGRASQMNAGARIARGEWLLFLHADTILPTGAIRRLNDFEGNPLIQAGGFLHRFSGHDWRLRLVSWLDNLRCRSSRIIYGDQALFVRRGLFDQLNGFPDQPILEDVAFCERLVRVTRPVLLSPPVTTDSRKFVKMGIWRSLARCLLIILHAEFRLPLFAQGFFQDIR